MLLEFNVFNDLEDPKVHSTLHICAAGDLKKLQNSSSVKTASSFISTKKKITYQIGASGSSPSESGESYYSELLDALNPYLTGNPQSPEIFGYSNQVAAGVYLGGSVQQASNVDFAIEKLRSFLSDTTYSAAAIQYCGSSSNETSGAGMGESVCQDSGFDKSATGSTSLTFLGTLKANGTQSKHPQVSRRSHGSYGHHVSHSYQRRDDTCAYREVVSGDTCYSLWTDCGITSDEFYEYNTATDLCTGLVQSGDSCSALASIYSLTEAKIETYNNETWAWQPFYPLPIANIECGPQVTGTVFNSTDSGDWESYNPCLLNACYNAFSQCVPPSSFYKIGYYKPAKFSEFMELKDVKSTLVQNIVDYVSDTSLDGIDIDWEYLGIPAGSDDEGDNYLAFLKELKAALPDDTIFSIMTPSSYWCLQAFPISEMADVVDFIYYMTYDLHGTWDEESTWADNGCTAGDCLFSHANITETEWALAMLTKTLIATNQIMVEVASYGCSFEISEEGCYDSSCTWTGAGRAGECTNTAGYISNAEINQILLTNENSQAYTDGNTTRTTWYKGYNFGGTAEWAVDLEEFVDKDESSSDSSGGSSDDTATLTIDPDTGYSRSYLCAALSDDHASFTVELAHHHFFPPIQRSSYFELTWDPGPPHPPSEMETSLCFIITTISMSHGSSTLNLQISAGQTAVYQTSSVTPTPFTVVHTPTVGGSTTVIGGTTSIIPGFDYSSGSITYTTSNYTGIWEVPHVTSVSGGTTQTPRTSTVTSLAYPTTTNKTPDPTLNTKTTTVKSSSDSSSWGPKAISSSEHTGSICIINCFGGCSLCPPDLSIEISGGGGDGGDDDNDDDDDTNTEIAYTTTMIVSGTFTTVTESATTKTETESESATSTETTSTITVGIAVGTYTAFAESIGAMDASTYLMASLTSLASLFAKELSSLYSAEQYSLTAGLYTTSTSTKTTSKSTTSSKTSTTDAATATPSE
ncbi:glycoside hydrolase [Penicillium verhagenii]|nr:glycoside hydrolase [Penicillium verhagenii]